MQTFRLILSLGALALAAYIVFTFAREYREAKGSTWDRLLEASRDSATILWQKFVILVAAVGASLGQLADMIDQPELKESIQSALKPEYVAAFVIGTALVSWWARKRTM
jgi:hypothetical protein